MYHPFYMKQINHEKYEEMKEIKKKRRIGYAISFMVGIIFIVLLVVLLRSIY